MSSSSSATRGTSTDPSGEPVRSRNAKAQARHRAKRKAYIEHLECTVTKLQLIVALSPQEVAALPSTLANVRELKEENENLHREIKKLQRQLDSRNTELRSGSSPANENRPDCDVKRQKLIQNTPGPSHINSSPPLGHTPPLSRMSLAPFNHTEDISKVPSAHSPHSLSPLNTFDYHCKNPSDTSPISSTSLLQPPDYTPFATFHHRTSPLYSPSLSQESNGNGSVKRNDPGYPQPSCNHDFHRHGYPVSLPPFEFSQSALNWYGYSAART